MRLPSRKIVAGAAVALLAAFLPALGADQQVDEAAFRRVSDKLICQCGCNYGLTHCPHLQCPSAPVLRAVIREKLATGQSETQVLEAMVAQFGPAVLAAPPKEGFNWTAWVMPFVALVLGLWIVQAVVRRWRARPPAPAADPAVVEQYRARLDRETKRLEE